MHLAAACGYARSRSSGRLAEPQVAATHAVHTGDEPRGVERSSTNAERSSASAELASESDSPPVHPERAREQLPLPRLLPAAAATATAAVAGATTTRTQVRPQEQGKGNGKGEGPEQTR